MTKAAAVRTTACCVMAFLIWHFDARSAQVAKAGPAGVPALQFFNVSRVPPTDWELDGAISAGDFLRLLMRVQDAARDVPKVYQSAFGARDYRAEHFTLLTGPGIIRADLSESDVEVLEAPEHVSMIRGGPYLLPLLVRNGRMAAVPLIITTPTRRYEVELPAKSVRGYALRLRNEEAGDHSAAIELQAGGVRKRVPLRLSVKAAGRLRVKLSERGDNAPAARVTVTGSDGLPHTPSGEFSRMTLMGGQYFFHAGSEFEIELPPGPAKIEAVRGIEYAPAVRTVEIVSGKTQTVDVPLDHRFRMAERGWFSGDAHIHANYIGQVRISGEDVARQVSAEGLDYANLMVANIQTDQILDGQFFEGKPSRFKAGHRILYWNEEMRNAFMYGHMVLFNLKRLVEPIYTGFAGTPFADDYPPNLTQARAAKEQGGAVSYAHPSMEASFKGSNCLELPVDVALGQVDAIDVLSNADEMASMQLWYRLMNCGFRCAISAGTDSFTNQMWHQSLGGGRVYAHVGRTFTPDGWISAFKAGRTFVSNGPMISLKVNGREPGDELRLGAGGASLRVVASAESMVPMDRLEIVVNGEVKATAEVKPGSSRVELQQTIRLDRSSWVAARVLGPGHRLVVNDAAAFAHTGAVYCYLGNRPIRSREDARFWAEWVRSGAQLVREKGVFSKEEQRAEVLGLYRKAEEIYQAMANGDAAGDRKP